MATYSAGPNTMVNRPYTGGSVFSDKQGRGFPSTVSSRTNTSIRDGSNYDRPIASYRSFSEINNPRGRTTNTMVVGPDDNLSARFIYPDGSGYEQISGKERLIQLQGGGEDYMPSGIMANVVDNPVVNRIKEGYEQFKPFIPSEIDQNVNSDVDFYGYEAPVGPGTMTFGTDKDFSNFYGGFKMNFDDGGIATLAGDLEQRMTPPDAQVVEPKKLTDEQKDYLMDYMLDFMFKQKQREQQEMEGRVPMFNYFDMEV